MLEHVDTTTTKKQPRKKGRKVASLHRTVKVSAAKPHTKVARKHSVVKA
jgi:hypothetical protein